MAKNNKKIKRDKLGRFINEGKNSKTKEYNQNYKKEYYIKNKEKIKGKSKKYQKENPEKIKRYKNKNKEKIKLTNLKWKKKHPEKIKNYDKKWRSNNNDKIKKLSKNYYEENKQTLKVKNKIYRIKNKELLLEKKKEKQKTLRKIDNKFKIISNLRSRFYLALKQYSKTGKVTSSKKYGIDYNAIIESLKPFPKNLSKYHIDHIQPLCSFDLNNPEEVKKAFAPENHQWLLAKDNLEKGGKF